MCVHFRKNFQLRHLFHRVFLLFHAVFVNMYIINGIRLIKVYERAFTVSGVPSEKIRIVYNCYLTPHRRLRHSDIRRSMHHGISFSCLGHDERGYKLEGLNIS